MTFSTPSSIELPEARLRLGRARPVAAEPVVVGQRGDASAARGGGRSPRRRSRGGRRSGAPRAARRSRRRASPSSAARTGRAGDGLPRSRAASAPAGARATRRRRSAAASRARRAPPPPPPPRGGRTPRSRPSPGSNVASSRTRASSPSADGKQEEALELDARRCFGRSHEQRGAAAEQRAERHDEALADVVDRPGSSPGRSAGGNSSADGRARPASGGRAVSSPIDEVGSCPCAADGRTTTVSSSRV